MQFKKTYILIICFFLCCYLILVDCGQKNTTEKKFKISNLNEFEKYFKIDNTFFYYSTQDLKSKVDLTYITAGLKAFCVYNLISRQDNNFTIIEIYEFPEKYTSFKFFNLTSADINKLSGFRQTKANTNKEYCILNNYAFGYADEIFFKVQFLNSAAADSLLSDTQITNQMKIISDYFF